MTPPAPPHTSPRAISRTRLWTTVAANLIPLVGVFALGWNAFAIVFSLYTHNIPNLIGSAILLPLNIVRLREMQKLILIGEKGKMIKKLGTESRQAIEEFLGSKVFLELFVKVRPKWRDQDIFLREYGYE